ncbi:MAG: hypothetical protein JWQ81_2600 [Amycolatopsis sp.]|jgi:predicted dithiol-disulfide oxidoreductase (DUF899 family)|uniref:DUF899 family protein n=1 Tax=Amycolatopsis sp. TaxID=37632 RepID=UPI00261B5DE0|nr:DUF899 family protein [Amycolatopsis sp.]MCU1681861.1 hypothetical protein [Amycolatopsis sp.]
MTLSRIGTREEWLAARIDLLAREKAATRLLDGISAARRELPRVEIDKKYVFEGVHGQVGLLDLFEGREQLIIQHVMWVFDGGRICPMCAGSIADRGGVGTLNDSGITLAMVARGPWPELEAYSREHGLAGPWYSSHGSEFNFDFHVSMDDSVTPAEYNYRGRDASEKAGKADFLEGEQPGNSVFIRDGDRVFHTYSTFARGVELLDPVFGFLDVTPLGRPVR